MNDSHSAPVRCRRRREEADPLGLGVAKTGRSAEEQEQFDKDAHKQVAEGLSVWDAQEVEEEERRRAREEEARQQEERVEDERDREDERMRDEEDEGRVREEEEEERAERLAREQRGRLRDERRRERAERRREEDAERERQRAEERGPLECDAAEWSTPPALPVPRAPEELLREAYGAMFGAAGTSPLHALCMNACINSELLGDLVQGMSGIQVWVGDDDGGIWSGESDAPELTGKGGVVGLMAMAANELDHGRLPLHAAAINGSCPAACLAHVLHEHRDAVWQADNLGLTPLALAVLSKPQLLASSDPDAAVATMAPKREAGGETIQRWGKKEVKLGQGIEGMVRGSDLRPDGGPVAVEDREKEEERRGVALHQKLQILLEGAEYGRAGHGRVKRPRKKKRTPPGPPPCGLEAVASSNGELELELAFYRDMFKRREAGDAGSSASVGGTSASGDATRASQSDKSAQGSEGGCGHSITSSAASANRRFVDDVCGQAIADGVMMATTPSTASETRSRHGSVSSGR